MCCKTTAAALEAELLPYPYHKSRQGTRRPVGWQLLRCCSAQSACRLYSGSGKVATSACPGHACTCSGLMVLLWHVLAQHSCTVHPMHMACWIASAKELGLRWGRGQDIAPTRMLPYWAAAATRRSHPASRDMRVGEGLACHTASK
jgi:hypothetical protein